MKLRGITKNVGPAALIAAGDVGSEYAAKFIPVGNDKLKAGIIAILGLAISAGKNKSAQNFGLGLAAGGIRQGLKSFGIGGDDTMIAAPEVMIADVEENMSGYSADSSPDASY